MVTKVSPHGNISNDASSYLGLVVNPFFDISQQYGTTSTAVAAAATSYGLDQFQSGGPGTYAHTFQQVADPFSATANYKRVRSSLKLTVTTAQATLGAGDYFSINQPIEGSFWKQLGWGTTDAIAIDVMFIISASVSGTYSLSIRNGALNRSYVVPFTLVANTPTTVFATIPGDTTGTWATDTSVASYVILAFGSGATFQAPSNSAWQAGNYIAVSGGTNITATISSTISVGYMNIFAAGVLPWQNSAQVDLAHLNNMRRPYDEELRRCQRYFVRYSGSNLFLFYGTGTGGAAAAASFPHSIPLRSAPISAVAGSFNLSNVTSVSISPAATQSFYIYLVITATGTYQFSFNTATADFNSRM